MELTVNLLELHEKQQVIKDSPAKRKVIRAGRRGGKTTLAADIAVDAFLDKRRVLYATPTQEQIDRFWYLSKQFLHEPIEAGIYAKNETRHIIERPGTENRIRAKTAWNADTMRGDYGDIIILDEFQDMDPDALELVVYPMLLDTDGDLILIYTKKRGLKGKHASDRYKQAENDKSGRWAAFHFTSHDNPHLSKDALDEITQDMTRLSYEMEILALERDDDPSALWSRKLIEDNRLIQHPDLDRVVVAVDPPGSTTTECGICVAGSAYINNIHHAYVIDDPSLLGSPQEWGRTVVTAYHRNLADRIVAEANYGGDMVRSTIMTVDPDVPYRAVQATRGKAVRAEPVVAMYEQGRVHHVGTFGELEDEMCNWVPGTGMPSPNRVDALVWAITDLLVDGGRLDVF